MAIVHLTGYLTVPPEDLAAVRKALPLHIQLTRAEPGCLSFEVHESASQPGRFAVAEQFRDRAALETHQARAETSRWGRLTRGMTRAYQITEKDDSGA